LVHAYRGVDSRQQAKSPELGTGNWIWVFREAGGREDLGKEEDGKSGFMAETVGDGNEEVHS
jgi:hypothetical protein